MLPYTCRPSSVESAGVSTPCQLSPSSNVARRVGRIRGSVFTDGAMVRIRLNAPPVSVAPNRSDDDWIHGAS